MPYNRTKLGVLAILVLGTLIIYTIESYWISDDEVPFLPILTTKQINLWSYSHNNTCTEETKQYLFHPKSMSPQVVEVHKHKWKSFINSIMPPSTNFSGKGIVMTAYPKVLIHALRTLKFLRYHNSSLPIEIWHKGEFSELERKQLTQFPNVVVKDLDQYNPGLFSFTKSGEKLYSVKGGAVVYSSFSEILFLDSDNLPLKNPEFLFDHPAYLETGAIFWPDYWKTRKDNPIWDILEIPCTTEFEQESGQMVVRKSDPAIWKALNLATYFQNEKIFGTLSLGDKDTYRWAWRTLKIPYHMVRAQPGSAGKSGCNIAMVQFSPFLESSLGNDFREESFREEPLFLHLTLFKRFPWTKDVFQEICKYPNQVQPEARTSLVWGPHVCIALERIIFRESEVDVVCYPFNSILPWFADIF
eukprot:TRINITY_DN6274_c0_g1_i3.p1 TRINITY_DN6274_c0_g1~~TRINITY_DN6274_c0_g1_i3.p1  ORF type:complete len:415 (+),score=55.22 TRINITY_DN6274_c0_g1_i3:80-1324(+)